MLSRSNLLQGFTLLLGSYFLLVGVGCLVAPDSMAGQFSIATIGARGLSTVRGDLGGLFLAMGIMSFLGYRTRWRSHRFLQAIAILLAVIALGRLPGLLLDGFEPIALILALIELALAAGFTLAAMDAARTGTTERQ